MCKFNLSNGDHNVSLSVTNQSKQGRETGECQHRLPRHSWKVQINPIMCNNEVIPTKTELLIKTGKSLVGWWLMTGDWWLMNDEWLMMNDDLGDISETSWGTLGDILVTSWGHLGNSWWRLGDILGISWTYLGDILRTCWCWCCDLKSP